MNNKKLIRISIITFVLMLFLVVIPVILSMLVDWYWFEELGYQNLFYTSLFAKIIFGSVVGVSCFTFTILNLLIAVSITRRFNKQEYINRCYPALAKQCNKLALLTSLIIGLIAGVIASTQWEAYLKYFNSTYFNKVDPLLNNDISYYIFTLPFIKIVMGYAFYAVIASLVLGAAIYVIKGFFVVPRKFSKVPRESYAKIKPIDYNFIENKAARFHLSILTAFILILSALQTHYISIPELTFSSSDLFVGAGYADIYATLPILRALSIGGAVCAVLIIINALNKQNSLAYWAINLYVVLGVGLYIVIGIIQGAYSVAIQNFVVIPNELTKEAPYIEYNIKATQEAWGIDKVEKKELSSDISLNAKDISDNELTLKNVRIWERQPLMDTFSQLQEIRTYYDFTSIDNDRYNIDDEYRQVMLSARELNTESLPNKSFINEFFTFTHGYGLTLAPVNQATDEGLPVLYVKDLPTSSEKDVLQVTRPEIYFGELSSDYVFVNTNAKEFDYPQGDENVFSEYEGSGGVKIDNILKKALYALHFRSLKIFLSNDLDRDSRIMYNRNIKKRVEKAMQFLRYDSDPYLVIDGDGALKWIYDAYTTSNHYPYSQTLNTDCNYIRNSVKVIVDAYNGSMEFYIADQDDPIIKTYEKIFPGVFKPLSDMPQDLKSHLRYPEDIFNYQTQLYRNYHMDETQLFYNREDQWEIPYINEGEKDSIDPIMRHLIMKLPNEQKEEYILMIPFTPREKDNMAAWMVARSDGDNYGKLVVYQFGKQKLVYGPKQINNRINQDAEISRQISLWDQRGSEVIQGNLLVIPIEESLLYVMPLYIRAEGGKIPELKRVIVAYDDKIVMEKTLDLAIKRIIKSKVKEDVSDDEVKTEEAEVEKEVQLNENLIHDTKIYFEEAQEAMQRGDWATYGENNKKLEEILKQL